MSYTTISRSVMDEVLQDRIRAAVYKEALANPTFGDTPLGRGIREGKIPLYVNMMFYPGEFYCYFVWPICIDNEAAYAYALGMSNPNPGGDEGVISDAAIGSGVQVHWPQGAE